MVLTHKTEVNGPFWELLRGAQKGDIITIFEGVCLDWKAHLDGVEVRTPKGIFLNGDETEEKRDHFCKKTCCHQKGEIVFKNGSLYLNDEKIPTPHSLTDWYSSSHSWEPHMCGVFLHRDNGAGISKIILLVCQ